MYMEMREIYFKELAHVTVGFGKSKIHRAGELAGNRGMISVLQSWGRIPSLGNLGLFSQGPQLMG